MCAEVDHLICQTMWPGSGVALQEHLTEENASPVGFGLGNLSWPAACLWSYREYLIPTQLYIRPKVHGVNRDKFCGL